MLRDYEVLVVVSGGKEYYSERLKRYVMGTTRKWIHIEGVRSHDQAVALAQKQGRRVMGVRKFDPLNSLVNIEKLQLNQKPLANAIEMDELIVTKQQKKIDNRWKDKAKVFGLDSE